MNAQDPLIRHLFKGHPADNPNIPASYLLGKGFKEIDAFLKSLAQRREIFARRRCRKP